MKINLSQERQTYKSAGCIYSVSSFLAMFKRCNYIAMYVDTTVHKMLQPSLNLNLDQRYLMSFALLYPY